MFAACTSRGRAPLTTHENQDILKTNAAPEALTIDNSQLTTSIDDRKINVKCSSRIRVTFRSDESVVVFDNFLADGEPDASTAVFRPGVESLKYLKYFLLVLRIKTNAVVADANVTILPGVIGIE